MNTSPEYAVAMLNQAHMLDPVAMTALIGPRVPCNNALGDHPHIRVQPGPEQDSVGVLGLLNGLFPGGERGYIEAVYDDITDELLGFQLSEEYTIARLTGES